MRHMRYSSMLAALLTGTILTQAQDSDRDSRRAAAADQLFSAFKGPRPGCAVGVFRAGTVVYSRAFGMANVELEAPLSPDTVFALDSMSKQFTGMSIVLLELRQKLSIDDDVHKYIPELPIYAAPVTISDLLHHTSGLKDGSELAVLAGFRPPFDVQTKGAFLDLILRQHTLNFAPGSEYLYSDTNYFLLGLIVERVSGRTLAAFAKDEIFTPLGMTHTEFREDSSKTILGRATQYNKNYDPSPRDGLFHNADSHVEVLGADGVFSTLADLAKWDSNFYQPVVGGREAIDLLLKKANLKDGSPNEYAAGLIVGTFHGMTKIEHSGGGAGSDSEMIRLPDQRLTIAVLCNVRDEDPNDRPFTAVALTRKMLDTYLDPTSPASPSSVPTSKPAAAEHANPALVQRFAGLYWNGRFDRLYRLAVKEGGIIATTLPDGRATPMEVSGEHQLQTGPATMTFNSAYTEAEISAPATPHRKLFRVEQSLSGPTVVQQFAGVFYSPDVDAIWRLTATGNDLTLNVRSFAPEVLRPAFRDAFFTDRGLLRFHRDERGRVDGFEMGNARVWNVGFRRVELPRAQP